MHSLPHRSRQWCHQNPKTFRPRQHRSPAQVSACTCVLAMLCFSASVFCKVKRQASPVARGVYIQCVSNKCKVPACPTTSNGHAFAWADLEKHRLRHLSGRVGLRLHTTSNRGIMRAMRARLPEIASVDYVHVGHRGSK